MNDWVEIFRAGTHTPSSGEPVTVTAEQVEGLVRSYDPSFLEAPIVVGHPSDNAPAFGWVEQLKAEGGRLFAKFKQVHEGFRSAVNEGRFKRRSVSLYRDLDGRGLYLRHVGFLGATAPAVKGLEPIGEFQSGEFDAFDFNDGDFKDGGKSTMNIEDLKKALDEAFANFGEKFKSLLPGKPDAAAGGDVQAQIDLAVTAATKGLSAQFSEKLDGLKAQLAEEREQRAAAQQTAATSGVDSFREKLRAEGRWAPAFDRMGVHEFMQALAGGGEAVEFSDGEGDDAKTVKQSPLEFFQGFLSGLPKIVEFKELTPDGQQAANTNLVQFNAPKGGQDVLGLDIAEQATALAREKEISYAEALGQVRLLRAG